jgi:type IV secretory pathway TrbD component
MKFRCTAAILLWTTSAAIGFGLQQIWVLPFAILMHVVLVALTRRDPFFFEVFIRALKSPKRLDP